MEIIAKELKLDEGHQDVFRLFIAVYRNFMEVCFLQFLTYYFFLLCLKDLWIMYGLLVANAVLIVKFLVEEFYIQTLELCIVSKTLTNVIFCPLLGFMNSCRNIYADIDLEEKLGN